MASQVRKGRRQTRASLQNPEQPKDISLSVISGESYIHDSHEFGQREDDLFSPLPFKSKMAKPLTKIIK